MHQRYIVESLLFMLTLSVCLLYRDGRVRPTYEAVNRLEHDSQLGISLYSADPYTGVYLANRRQPIRVNAEKDQGAEHTPE